MDWLRRFWVDWFGWYAGREGGDPYRKWIYIPKDFIAFIRDCERLRKPCYLSVQPFKKRDEVYGLDRLFFDFDCKDDPNKAWRDASDFVENLKRFYNITPLLVFSGRKGYHVYIFLWETIEFKPSQQHLLKPIYSLLQEKLLKGLDYPTLDREVIGDVKRLARVPYTTHEKSGLKCHPVTLKQQKLWVFSLDGYRRHGIQEAFFFFFVEEAKLQKKLNETHQKTPRRHINFKRMRPCLLEALDNPQLDHKTRVAIVAEAYRAGLSIKEIEALFLKQSDFNLEQTEYQIRHVIEGGYKPFRRSTLRDLGVCHGSRCGICLKVGRVVSE